MFLIEKIMKMLKIKKNVITIIIENDIKNKNENINIKSIINNNEKWLITIIGN